MRTMRMQLKQLQMKKLRRPRLRGDMFCDCDLPPVSALSRNIFICAHFNQTESCSGRKTKISLSFHLTLFSLHSCLRVRATQKASVVVVAARLEQYIHTLEPKPKRCCTITHCSVLLPVEHYKLCQATLLKCSQGLAVGA